MTDHSSNQRTQQPQPNADANENFELRVEPFQGTPEEIERQWFEQVY